jgi:uncharacterized integral membrane protein
LLRRIVAAIILIPLAVVIIAFAVANRQSITVSFDPFDPAQPAYAKQMWLFVPIFAALIIGVAIGGFASWLRHGGWRRTAKRLDREVVRLRAELDTHRHAAAKPPAPDAANPPEPMRLRPPAG